VVYLYWSGHYSPPPSAGINTVTVVANGGPATPVTGTSIGGPTCFFALGGVSPCPGNLPTNLVFQTFRADITSSVHTGANSLVVGGMGFAPAADGFGNDGVGVIAVSDNGSGSTVGLVDGQDLAFCESGNQGSCGRFLSPLDATVPQTFTFPSSASDRTGTLSTLASSVKGPASGGSPLRPNQLVLTFAPGGQTQTLQNPWGSLDGPEFDALDSPVTIPAGATSASVQAVSGGLGGLPASLNWLAAGLTVPPPTVPQDCTIGDFVWIDKNQNGIQDADELVSAGVNGVEVELLDANGNSFSPAVLTTTTINPATGAPGWYSFKVTCGVTYKVRVTPKNFEPGHPLATCKTPTTQNAPGSTTANDSNGDKNSTSGPVTVTPPPNADTTIDFGYVCPIVCVDGKFGGTLQTSVDGQGNLHILFDQFTNFNDNSYGVNTVGWGGPGKHKFQDLTGSDKAQFIVNNAAGQPVLNFAIDYISCATTIATPSQCASLGVSGGDGGFTLGNKAWILSWNTSLAHNLNDHSFCTAGNCTVAGVNLKLDSPPTVSQTDYTLTNPAFTGWNFANQYEVVISKDAAPGGFGTVTVPLVHNSPAKPSPTCPTTGTAPLCASGTHLASLDIEYTADPCSASDNNQAADKWNCSGVTTDPIGADPVRLVIMDRQLKSDGTVDPGAKKYVDKMVSAGDNVTIAGSAIGENTLKGDTYWAIYSGTTLLQKGKFKTDCSTPIAVGDQFGALVLTGGTNIKT
jgi:hypothetical protein